MKPAELARSTEATKDDTPSQLTLIAAAERFQLGCRSLRAAADAGVIRYRDRRRHGRGHSYRFDVDELASDLARLPRCTIAGCPDVALLHPERCQAHARHLGALAADRALLADPNRSWLTGVEAATLVGVAPETLRAAERRGEISSVLVGRHRRYERTEVEIWAARWREAPSTGYEKRRGQTSNRVGPMELTRRREQVRRIGEAGHSVAQIAELTGWSIPTVRRDLDALGIERPNRGKRPRWLPLEARKRRQHDAVRLYRDEGRTLKETAKQLDSSPTQIGRDLRAAGVPLRRGGPPPKYEQPTARACLHCGEVFVPEFPALGHRKFCKRECADAERTVARHEGLERRGLLGTREVAEREGIGERRVIALIETGHLRAERIVFPYGSRPGYGVAPDELERFERERARNGRLANQLRRWLDADYVVDRYKRHGWLERLVTARGLTMTEAETVIRARVAEKAASLARRRRGRKRASAPPAAHLRWLAAFPRVRRELEEAYRRDLADGDLAAEAVTDWKAAAALAERDWREHPEDWPRDRYPTAKGDPDALAPPMARPAARRVITALKRLQSAVTEKAAA